MLSRLSCFCIALLFFGCNNPVNKQTIAVWDSTNSASITGINRTDTIPFAGYWVNETYVNSLLRTKSPSKTVIPEQSCIFIPAQTGERTLMVYGFHEAGEDIFVMKKETGWELWDTAAKNERGVIGIIPGGKIKIDTGIFVRLEAYDKSKGQFNPPIVEEFLFKGNYVTGKGSPVAFNADGSISGFAPFVSFTTPVDYFDQGMQVDQLTVTKADGSTEKMAFRFSGDKLLLYELKCINYDSTYKICAEVTFGKLLHTLTRQSKK